MNPSIKLDIDPHAVEQLSREPRQIGGIRVKTVIYVVTSPDISLNMNETPRQTVTTIVVPQNAKVELRVIE